MQLTTLRQSSSTTVKLASACALALLLPLQAYAETKSNADLALIEQCSSHYQAADSHSLKLVSDKLLFLEGPTWSVADQAFYFSEMNFSGSQLNGPDANIYQYKLNHKPTLWLSHSGSNGLLADGNDLYVLKHSDRSVNKINLSTQKQTVVVNQFDGKPFNSPNDISQHSNGGIYFSDPDWQLSERKNELNSTSVFWLSASGELVELDQLNKPNGVVLSPDEHWLYVGDYSNHIYRYPVNNDGSVGERQPFIDVDGPDGITIDCAGNLYVASHSQGKLQIYSPEGKLHQSIAVAPQITNMDFGGKDMKTLLITTGNGLFTLQTQMAGIARK
ncbi:SMP-30/gluconolactonase/LRE family protein [Shewanella livingstonensis]|nr:SMP-30/gluconolactonase/LRE family protein [Shewanella livingstonensis]